MMRGKFILLGITGGIAAYKAAELVRLLVKAGAEVHVIMTEAAQKFVTPLTFQTLSMNPVHTDLFNLIGEREIGHISLADRADVVLIAPATANIVGKLASGIADDFLSTTVLATKAPVLIAPAMNSNMYENPLYQENQEKLRKLGFHFVDPVTGGLACGWEGQGKLPDPVEICEAVSAVLSRKDLLGERLLVTAGPTREELDPVRYISNYSSGKMGYAIARAAMLRGAEVTLVSGPVALKAPSAVNLVHVSSAEEMRTAAMQAFAAAGIVIMSAAVADYRPEFRSAEKMKKNGEQAAISLVRNPDILAEMGRSKGERLLIGFAAETEQLLAHASKKLDAKNLDMIVANDVSREGAGFCVDTNIVKLVYRDGRVEDLPLMTKDLLADELLDRVLALKTQKRGRENE
jgi:phosphopantothenoylcysteine decarboxylase / phosphopantothenate---cysteine ligase